MRAPFHGLLNLPFRALSTPVAPSRRGAISDLHAFKGRIQEANYNPLCFRINEDDVFGDGTNFQVRVQMVAGQLTQSQAQPCVLKTHFTQKFTPMRTHILTLAWVCAHDMHTYLHASPFVYMHTHIGMYTHFCANTRFLLAQPF